MMLSGFRFYRGSSISFSLSLVLFFLSLFSIAECQAVQAAPPRYLIPNPVYEQQTEIRKSGIPGAGRGLFALVLIKKGETIGEYGGQLLLDKEYPYGKNEYIAGISKCAQEKGTPYRYIDGRYKAGKVTRINFAPSKINGHATNFQNASIKQLCKSPFFIFVALRDIQPKEEILASYGKSYNYKKFMKYPKVRDYFCGLLKVECNNNYKYEY